jgi:hypothetical protein
MSSRPHADPDAQKYREKCIKIIAISPKIRYAGIMNKFGRTIAGALRKGVVPMLKPEEAKSEYFIEAARIQMRRNFENSIGRTEYSFTENQKVKIATVPVAGENYFIYVTMDKDTPMAEVIKIIESAGRLL